MRRSQRLMFRTECILVVGGANLISFPCKITAIESDRYSKALILIPLAPMSWGSLRCSIGSPHLKFRSI